ncbi:MAG: hypothetical protein WA733_20115, partial [Methylocystis sp.]
DLVEQGKADAGEESRRKARVAANSGWCRMPKLTDSQLIVRSKAAARDDGAAAVPEGIGEAAAAKVGSSLVARKLMREIRSKPGMPIWREADGKNISLVITRAGRDAIGVNDDATASDHAVPKAARSRAAVKTQKASAAAESKQRSIDSAPRPGSKQALMVEMLRKERGRVARRADQGDGLVAAYDEGGADRTAQERL